MNYDSLFLIVNGIAAVGWIVMFFASPGWKRYDAFVIGIIVVLLAVSYTVLNFVSFNPDLFQKFSTLSGVMELFQQKRVVVAAWCHILAFDLIGAVWMKKNSLKYNMKHVLLILPFIFTFLLGPLGFLLYILTRWIKTGDYFAAD